MKKKFILIQFIIIFLLSSIIEVRAIDATYTRENGNNLVYVATKIEDDLYLDGEYGAYSNLVTGKDVKIYNYEQRNNWHKRRPRLECAQRKERPDCKGA